MSTGEGAVEEVRRLLGVRVPVVGAPMARISGGALAAAVSQAGGFGFVGAGYAQPDWVDEQLDVATRLDATVGVGLITWILEGRREAVERLLARGVRHMWLSFGDPSPFLPLLREAGAVALCQVQTVAEACAAVAAGADIVVAQGEEAGGHGRAGTALAQLLPEVVAAVRPVPVLAAGGLATAAQVTAALALGAGGAALGTRLYATREALDSAEATAELVRRDGSETRRTTVFDLVRGPRWPDGYTGRAVVNDTVRRWAGREGELAADAARLAAEHDRHADAVRRHDVRERVVWAGTGLDHIHDVPPAEEVVRRLSAGLTG